MARHKKSRPKPHPKRVAVRAAVDGSDLCLQCGLCCDGTLFTSIPVGRGELDFVESLGLPVEARSNLGPDGVLGDVRQPCPALVGGICSAYSVGRPRTCETYRCELLTQYLDGARHLHEVLPVVHLVRSLVRELEVEMEIPAGAYTRRALQRYVGETRPWEVAPGLSGVSPEHERFLVAFRRLYQLGVKYFQWEPVPAEVESADAGAKVTTSAAADTA